MSGGETSTRQKLVEAAMAEFNAVGFQGTDTNRIARRAGLSPQTFYRWFKDKGAIFIAAYVAWEEGERRLLEGLLGESSDSSLARVVVEHHRAHLIFRRSLRALSLDNDQIRAARAASRLRQISLMRGAPHDNSNLATSLLQIERLADALAEGEFEDMGLSRSAAESALAELIGKVRPEPTRPPDLGL